MKKGLYILFLLLFMISYKSEAQEFQNGVQIKAKSTGNEILIRWAPSSPITWKYANQYGYTLERITLLENGKVILRPKSEMIGVFKPAPLPAWEEVVEDDDYSAVAAQSIYGENFNVTETFNSDMVKVVNQSRDLENKFSFALFASDMSMEAAKLSGLFYRDQNVHNEYEYLYRIYPNIPQEYMSVDTAAVLVGLKDTMKLPVIDDFEVLFGDQIVELTWSTLWSNSYSGYWLEKSIDGIQFESITQVPIVQSSNTNHSQVLTYDSLSQNNIDYFYRIRGVDYFGDRGPYSKVVSGVGKSDFHYSPAIRNVTETANGAKVFWEISNEAIPLIESFQLLREDPKNHNGESIITDIPKDRREIIDSNPRQTNYYIIRAKDKYGRTTRSFPYFFQPEDSVPPAPPQNLIGRIDTTGLVYLNWDPNEEDDLFGYKLYVSNFLETEFIQVPGPIITKNHHVDTLNLNSLTEEIYYQVRALDARFNPSEPSETAMLKKPDLIAPMSPVFTSIQSDSSGIHLQWNPSPSKDVKEYFLYRRSEEEEEWTLIEAFTPTDSIFHYLDRNIGKRKLYAYTFLTVDDAGLESKPANPVSIKSSLVSPQIFTNVYSRIDPVQKQVNIAWDISGGDVQSYHIYRSKNGLPLSLLNIIEGTDREFKDAYELSDEFAEYQLLAIFTDGGKSGFSRKIKVEF
ncbi:MAG: fibronectin type III domain-containing protein [Bacteroidota bacterium]